MAFLVTDVAVSEPEVRHTYTKIFEGMNRQIHGMAKPYADCDKEQIYAVTAMMIGAVAIGRALDDQQIRKKMLSSCQTLALALLNGELKK